MEKNESGFVVLTAEKNVTPEEAARLVRQRLSGQGREPWRDMEMEVYSGETGSLVIARQRSGERLYISVFALRYLFGRT